ncbi:hypothetical protein K370107A2_16940 [Merdimmobilis hominis]
MNRDRRANPANIDWSNYATKQTQKETGTGSDPEKAGNPKAGPSKGGAEGPGEAEKNCIQTGAPEGRAATASLPQTGGAGIE